MKCAHTGCGQVVQSKGWGGGRKHGHRSTGHRLIEIQMVQQDKFQSMRGQVSWHPPDVTPSQKQQEPWLFVFYSNATDPPPCFGTWGRTPPPRSPLVCPCKDPPHILSSLLHKEAERWYSDTAVATGSAEPAQFSLHKTQGHFPSFFWGEKVRLMMRKIR